MYFNKMQKCCRLTFVNVRRLILFPKPSFKNKIQHFTTNK